MDPEAINNGWLEPHLTDYVRDANMSESARSEARRMLALEAALTTSRNGATILRNAKKIETFLRGEGAVAELREATRSR